MDAAPDYRVEIVSGDRDLIQLVHDPEVQLLFTVRGVSELPEKSGEEPADEPPCRSESCRETAIGTSFLRDQPRG